jgi:ABC-type sulfate transport system substrate-binding protein
MEQQHIKVAIAAAFTEYEYTKEAQQLNRK